MQHTRGSRDLSIRSAAWGRARISWVASQGSDEEAEKEKRYRRPCWWGRGRLGLSGEELEKGNGKTETKGVGWGSESKSTGHVVLAACYWTELSQSRTRSNPDRARTSQLVFSSGQVQACPRAFLPVLMMSLFLMLDVEEHIPNINYFSIFNVWYWSIIEEDKTKCDLLLEIILPFFWCYGYIME